MAQTKNVSEVEKGPIERLLEVLADKHSQFDINLQGLNIRAPRTQLSIELNGLVTLTVHMRNLTEQERKASAAKNVALMSKTT